MAPRPQLTASATADPEAMKHSLLYWFPLVLPVILGSVPAFTNLPSDLSESRALYAQLDDLLSDPDRSGRTVETGNGVV